MIPQKIPCGKGILDRLVENTRKYGEETCDDIRKKELKDRAFNKGMACLVIRNSDKKKYSSLLNRLISQFSMDNNQYPKNIKHAIDILSNHKHGCGCWESSDS